MDDTKRDARRARRVAASLRAARRGVILAAWIASGCASADGPRSTSEGGAPGRDVIAEAPADVAADAPVDDVGEASVDDVADSSIDPPADAAADIAFDRAVDAPADTPRDAPADAMDAAMDAAVDAPLDVAVDRASDAPLDAMRDTARDTPLDTSLDATSDASLDAATMDARADAAVDAGPPLPPAVPVIDAAMKARLRAVYLSGQAMGNRAGVFSKVGDGITATGSFLTDIGCGGENLGPHAELASTIAYFRATSTPGRGGSWCGMSNSFTLTSAAAESGWTTASALAPVARPDCPAPYDTALRCELHLTRPSIALVMLGTNDLERVGDVSAYAANFGRIVDEAVGAGVVPVLSTLPPRLDNAMLGARVARYNDAVRSVAAARQVPLWDYWLAMTAPSMVNQGIGSDGITPNVYLDGYACNFTSAGLTYGFNQRNFTALQALAHVKAVVFEDGPPDPHRAADAGTDDPMDATVDAATDVMRDATWGACDGSAPLVPAATEAALAARRRSCEFTAGARAADTLGITSSVRSRIPVDHVVILMQENRSFDHYLGTMPGDVDRIPAGYSNPDLSGRPVRPSELTSTCVPDPPHQWEAMHDGWHSGAMDGFARSGALAGISTSVTMGYYTERELPFYRWLYGRFAMSDRYFASVLSGTWATRDFAYLGSSYGVRNTGDRVVADQPSIFDRLSAAGVSWGVYTDGGVRQNSIGWTNEHRGVHGMRRFYADLAAGALPSVVYLDAIDDATDEHPPTDIHLGERFVRDVVTGVMASPLWPRIALLVTYDEAGGFFDHVPPPTACLPHPRATAGYDTTDLDRLGVRVPFVVVSPWARPRYVSHVVHDHTSTLRFVEALFDLPALTARDANASALFDLFDFSCARSMTVGETIPAAGVGGCP